MKKFFVVVIVLAYSMQALAGEVVAMVTPQGVEIYGKSFDFSKLKDLDGRPVNTRLILEAGGTYTVHELPKTTVGRTKPKPERFREVRIDGYRPSGSHASSGSSSGSSVVGNFAEAAMVADQVSPDAGQTGVEVTRVASEDELRKLELKLRHEEEMTRLSVEAREQELDRQAEFERELADSIARNREISLERERMKEEAKMVERQQKQDAFNQMLNQTGIGSGRWANAWQNRRNK